MADLPPPDAHLPYDYARCLGVGLDDQATPDKVWREDCETCLRRLAWAPRPWYMPAQPEPCEYRIAYQGPA